MSPAMRANAASPAAVPAREPPKTNPSSRNRQIAKRTQALSSVTRRPKTRPRPSQLDENRMPAETVQHQPVRFRALFIHQARDASCAEESVVVEHHHPAPRQTRPDPRQNFRPDSYTSTSMCHKRNAAFSTRRPVCSGKMPLRILILSNPSRPARPPTMASLVSEYSPP